MKFFRIFYMPHYMIPGVIMSADYLFLKSTLRQQRCTRIMKHLINYCIAFSPMIGLLIAFLSLGVLVLLLSLFPDNNVVHSVPAEQCDMDVCIQPTVNDQNLKVELVTTDLNAPTNMVFLGNNDLLVLERYTGKVKRIINDTVQAEPLL